MEYSPRQNNVTVFCSVKHSLRELLTLFIVGLGGLAVTYSPRAPKFEDSNPAEVDGFLSGRKNPEHKSSGRDFKLGVPGLRRQAR